MNKQKLLNILIDPLGKNKILEKIKKYLNSNGDFFHIISLNPENITIAKENIEFKEAIEKAQVHIVDGFGIVLASRILGITVDERIPGVDLMDQLIVLAAEERLRVMLIGGKGDLANKLADCYIGKYSRLQIIGIEGITNIQSPQQKEQEEIFSIVARIKPHFIFVSFGSPHQELWLWRNRKKLKNTIGMGVGGAFDFLTGSIPRAPAFIRNIGLEWLFRLIIQPWRWRRQLRLMKFILLILIEKLHGNKTGNYTND